MLRVGTHHFVDRKAAVKYYKTCGEDAKAVTKKIKDGAICIGIPPVKENERFVTDEDGRYYLVRLNTYYVVYGRHEIKVFAESEKEARLQYLNTYSVPKSNHYRVHVSPVRKETPNAQ